MQMATKHQTSLIKRWTGILIKWESKRLKENLVICSVIQVVCTLLRI